MIRTAIHILKITLNTLFEFIYSVFKNRKTSENGNITRKAKMKIFMFFEVLVILLFIFFFIIYFFMAQNLRQSFSFSVLNYKRAYFVEVFTGCCIFSFVGNILFFNPYAYVIKNNELIKNTNQYKLIFSKIIATYVSNFIYNIIITIPAFIAYSVSVYFDYKHLMFYIFSLFALPLFITALSCIIISFLEVLSVKFRKADIVTGILGIVMFLLFILSAVLTNWIIKNLFKFFDNIDNIANFVKNTKPVCLYINVLYKDIHLNFRFVETKEDFMNMLLFVLIALVMMVATIFTMIIFENIKNLSKTTLITVMQILKVSLQSMLASMLSFISGKRNLKKLNSTPFGIVITIILVFFILALLSFFFGAFSLLAIALGGISNLYFFAVVFGTIIFSLMGSIFASQSYLFDATDNELLLSMPVKPSVILLSRVATLYSLNCIYSWIIMLPAFFAYIIFVEVSFIGLFFFLISIFTLPVFITSVGCIVGYLLWFLSSKMSKKNMASTLFGILMFSGFAVLGFSLQNMVKNLFELLYLIDKIVRFYLKPIYWYGIAVSKGDFICMILFINCCIIPMVPVFMFVSSKFIKIITTKTTHKKKVYIAKPMKRQNLKIALLKKELSYFLSMHGYILNSGMGTIMMTIMGIFIIVNGINVSEMVSEYVPNVDSIVKITVVTALSIMSAMNDVSAPSISLEANTLWILRSAPIKPMDVFMTKSLVAPIITIPGIIVVTVASVLRLPVNIIDIIFILIVPIMTSVFSGMLGVLINLRFPRFDWSSEIIVIKQSGSVLLSLLGAIFITGIPFIFAIILPALIDDFNIIISYMICFIYLFAVTITCYSLLKHKGIKMYNKL